MTALDVVIPTLNAADGLARCLAALAEGKAAGLVTRIVVIDGGSTDATCMIAADAGARVLTAPRGRGTQLAAGVAATEAPWVLTCHADTVLAPGWAAAVAAFVADPANVDRAGFGRLAFDDVGPAAHRIAALANWRAQHLGLPYGDQTLLLPRALYVAVGGYPDWPLMEDVALVRRIGRPRLVQLPMTAITSAARYRRDGWWARPIRNAICLALYLMGVAPDRIARLYAARPRP